MKSIEICEKSKLEALNLKGASNFKFSIEALCTPFICLPLKNKPITFAKNNFEFLKNLELADTGFSDDIELLIGSDFYWAFVTGNVRLGKVGVPVGVESKFGWLLSGPVPKQQSISTNLSFANENSSHVLFCNAQNSVGNHLDKKLHCFWDLESLGISEVEKSPFEDFSDTIYLNKERRHEANLPFKKPHPLLHDHFNLCEKRLLKHYPTLKKDTVLLKRYNDIFLNQMELGIIEPANENVSSGNCHYILHHPVIREDKNTSKVRIVFDAFAKSDGPSLNECLYKGPQLNHLVFDILIRFRSVAIALTSDIEKAFLQISINENNRDYLLFFWFDDVFFRFA